MIITSNSWRWTLDSWHWAKRWHKWDWSLTLCLLPRPLHVLCPLSPSEFPLLQHTWLWWFRLTVGPSNHSEYKPRRLGLSGSFLLEISQKKILERWQIMLTNKSLMMNSETPTEEFYFVLLCFAVGLHRAPRLITLRYGKARSSQEPLQPRHALSVAQPTQD